MFTLKSEPQDKLFVVKQGFHFYLHTFWVALPYSLLATSFILVPQLFIDVTTPSAVENFLHQTPLVLTTIISWLIGFILLSALVFRLHCITEQLPLTFLNSVLHALFKLIPLLLLGVVYILMIISGTLFLIIPGIILAVSLMFSFILFITDNQNVLPTLLTSHRLVWGNWWHTLLIISLPLLIDIAVSFSVLLLLFMLFKHYQIGLLELYRSLCFTNIVIQALFTPLIFCIAL
ncbi:MAG TPA: hypothetical protein PLD88_11400, partial [Candidatus Berkiella sp.]|nr:hypothetical protein [Candidatus Berkiella sp.]